jgi:general secretion pathway protein J
MRRTGGFTLLEMLVALMVLGLLMVGLTQGTKFGLQAFARQTGGLDATYELDAVDRAMRGLIEQMDPGAGAEGGGILGGPHELRFTTELPAAAAALPTRRADVALAVDAAHRLVLSWVTNPHAAWLGEPRRPEETVLLAGVQSIAIAYLPQGAPSDGWVASWRRPTPPRLVRLRIEFPPGDARHWPDIVAAPLRARS